MTNVKPDPMAGDELRQKIVDIFGLEVAPDGLPDHLLIRDENDVVLEGMDFSHEVNQIVQLFNAYTTNKIIEARIELLDALVTRWNNYIGDMPDKEKEQLEYIELTGMLWGIVAQFRIPLEQALNHRKDEHEQTRFAKFHKNTN